MTEHGTPDETPRISDLLEINRTTRSVRRLKPDPVPNELIRKIREAGVCAPSGGKMQQWRFLVIRDPKVKEAARAYYKRVGTSRHIHEAPVWIVPCLESEAPPRWSGSSIYPAVQNMLLAARALGLGARLTTANEQVARGEARGRLVLAP